MSEVEALFARARRYIESAGLLLQSEDYESAVSRVYYAMFYAVEALLLASGRTYSSHKAVISAFNQDYIKSDILPREMGKQLSTAFQKRQLGDYEYTFVITREEAAELTEIGTEFIDRILAHIASLSRT